MRGFIGLLSVAIFGAVAMAAEPTETINVTGSATVFVKPDAARIHYAVRVTDASADAARIDWIVTDDASPRREALRAALRKAKADAEALAKELGWEKITILSVSDGPSAAGSPEASLAAGRTPAGEVAISARVSIKCS